MANMVLPHPAEPQIKVGLPLGKPPSVISSKPFIPLETLSNVILFKLEFLSVQIPHHNYINNILNKTIFLSGLLLIKPSFKE